jgi:hypothetical protein
MRTPALLAEMVRCSAKAFTGVPCTSIACKASAYSAFSELASRAMQPQISVSISGCGAVCVSSSREMPRLRALPPHAVESGRWLHS